MISHTAIAMRLVRIPRRVSNENLEIARFPFSLVANFLLLLPQSTARRLRGKSRMKKGQGEDDGGHNELHDGSDGL